MFLKHLAYFLSSVFVCCAQKFVSQECSSNGIPGVCVYMNECKAAIDSYEAKGSHDLERCGFEGMTEIVCCLKDVKTHNFNDRFDNAPTLVKAPVNVSPSNGIATATRIEKRRSEIECAHIIETLQPPLDDHIIGGNDTKEGEFPHMVAIGYVKERETKVSFICGGSLISPTFVMTAAHCIKLNKAFPDMKPTVARIGVIDLSLDATDFNAKTDYEIIQSFAHPNYSMHYYDIGLLKLAKAVPYTLSAHAACLFNKNDVPNTVTVTGWGIVNWETRKRATKLQKLDMKVVPNENCSEHYKSFRTINRGIVNEMICAGGVLRQDSCQGDSGGPLQAITEADGHYRIVGITSFGRSCGSLVPGVYTKVFSYLDWIENIVWPLAE